MLKAIKPRSMNLRTPRSKTELKILTDIEIGWLAGILEGEGTLSSFRQAKLLSTTNIWKVYNQPRVQISSTDKDIVERIAIMANANLFKGISVLKGE